MPADKDLIRLRHILDAIQDIEHFIAGIPMKQFHEDKMIKLACIKSMEIIGEACNHLSEETKRTRPKVPWRQIIAMRHLFVHEYFGIDTQLVWDIIQDDIPKLKTEIASLLQD